MRWINILIRKKMISLSLYQAKTEKTAKSTDEAIKLALDELHITEDEANISVIEEGSKGFLGIGSKDSSVIVEAKDKNAAITKAFLSDVLNAMGIASEISAKSTEDGVSAEISGEHMGLVIGKRGDTLDSLQYLSSLVVNKQSDDRVRVILNTENYREKRQKALSALASRIADKVSRTGKKYTLEPMNPYERRIIHSCLQGYAGITTFSIGEEPYRKVVIAPERKNIEETPVSTPHISSRIAAEYRQQNHNKVKNFDEFLAENTED